MNKNSIRKRPQIKLKLNISVLAVGLNKYQKEFTNVFYVHLMNFVKHAIKLISISNILLFDS